MNPFEDEEKETKDDFVALKNDAAEEDESEEDDSLETPYDFRAEYKERITTTVPTTEEVDKTFSSIRFHAIGIGILVGVLLAVLVSALFWGNADDADETPAVITGNDEPYKERPAEPGGMRIPDQDKMVYKRMRTDDMDTHVERLFPEAEAPVEPVVQKPVEPVPVATREGQILGAPAFVPETPEQMELEVISTRQKAMKMEAAAPVPAPKPAAVEAQAAPKAKPAAQPTAAKASTATPAGSTWHVQLISLPSKSGAEKAWPKILKAHSALLSGLPHDVVAAEIKGKGTFYRLRVGAFKTRDEAKSLCDKLKARKQDCTLTK